MYINVVFNVVVWINLREHAYGLRIYEMQFYYPQGGSLRGLCIPKAGHKTEPDSLGT